MKKFMYTLTFGFVAIVLSVGCTSKTKESVDVTNTLLGNDNYLEVQKTNKNTTYTGLLTNANYGTSHRYSYKLTVNNGDINWSGGSGEPKHILFCKDSVYIHYLKEKYIPLKAKDSVGTIVEKAGHNEVQDVFAVHLDKRYFFKFFGDEYWIKVSSERYNLQKKSGTEYSVPNDNELSTPNTAIDQ
ncbi:hypothetical protein ACWGOQ_0004945 [Aquimarina sp. M1]